EAFLKVYGRFEELVSQRFPGSHLLLENRSGTTYRGGEFIVSGPGSLEELCACIAEQELRLRLALDLPQVFTAVGGGQEMTASKIRTTLESLHPCRKFIKSIHIWGKRRSASGRLVSHIGNLDTYFGGNATMKWAFLESLFDLLNDSHPRYVVPEVNSGSADVEAIVYDLLDVGFEFVTPDHQRMYPDVRKPLS
ncbi:hypothetical protein ACFLU6_14670, partial [Acidobacteriota bacterium]